jgi:predicted nucleic acid-binding protein
LIITIDTNVLAKWFSRKDEDDAHRLDKLLDDLAKARGKLIIPTPCLAEFLVGVDQTGMDWLAILERRQSIVVGTFDKRAAFECSLIDQAAFASGDKKAGRADSWQKIKIDRQVVAIAKVHNSTGLISQDRDLAKTAMQSGIPCRRIEDLALPDYAKQHKLDLEIAPTRIIRIPKPKDGASDATPGMQ